MNIKRIKVQIRLKQWNRLEEMEEKKQYSALTIDRAAFLLLRVKKAFKKKKLQRKERERR